MTVIVLIGLGIFLGQVQNTARTAGKTDPLSQGIRKITIPLSTAFDNGAQSVSGVWIAVANSSETQAKLQRLKSLERSVSLYEQTVSNLQRQLDQVRKLDSLPNFGKTKVMARIIGYFPYENRLSLSVGSDQEIDVGQPVVGIDGLIAIVQTVDKKTCQAVLVCSPSVKFGGMINTIPEVFGIMKGQTPSRLALDVLEAGKIEIGAEVLTSGFSTRIPRGIPVGTVAEIIPDPSYGTRRVFVAPISQLGIGLEVFILK